LQQQRLSEAVALLERLTAISPDDVLALNNLAAVLADQPGQGDKALGYIDRALAASPGAQPFLLDTRAKVLLYQHREREALQQLEAIVERWPNAEPRIYFHLALAYERSEQRTEAIAAFARARERGLEARHLTPGDRALWKELDARLARTDRRRELEGEAATAP
jgi:tetratricopeptide (TPR) repeat protein